MLNQSSWFIRISSAHVDLIRNLMIHFTLRQFISDLVQSCHQIMLSHFKTYRINCHFYESFHFMTIHSTCVVFLVVTAAHSKHICKYPRNSGCIYSFWLVRDKSNQWADVCQQILLNPYLNFTKWAKIICAKILTDFHFSNPTPGFFEESLNL